MVVPWAEAQRLRDFQAACEIRLRAARPDGALTQEEHWLRWSADLIVGMDPLARDYLPKAVSEYASVIS